MMDRVRDPRAQTLAVIVVGLLVAMAIFIGLISANSEGLNENHDKVGNSSGIAVQEPIPDCDGANEFRTFDADAAAGSKHGCGTATGSAHTIEDEGTPLTARATLNFTGAGVTCTDDAGDSETDCDIPGGAGSGDNVTVNSSAADTTANFLDGDIDWTLVDGGAGGPDDITATVACAGCIDATDLAANSVDGSELVDDSVDTTELDDTESPSTGQLVATDNATATRFEYIAVGAGLTHDGDTLSVDLGTSIETGEITDGTILEADLAAVDSPSDEECLTYEATGGDFEWQSCAASSGDITDVGDCATGAAFTGACGTTLTSNTDIIIALDDDNDGTASFQILDGADALVAEILESGLIFSLVGFDCIGAVDCDFGSADITDMVFTTDGTGDGEITLPAGSISGTEITDGSVDISTDTNLTCGTNCTLTDDEISVDDAFILNTGDVGTGVFDFGGADSFEIPNGTGNTVNADGEISHDTDADQLVFGASASVVSSVYQGSITIESPSDADNILLGKWAAYGITITDIFCIVDPADTAESVVIDLQERDATADNPATVDATITCDNDGAEDDGTLSNGAIDKNDWWSIDIGVVTGSVSQLSVTWVYTITRE